MTGGEHVPPPPRRRRISATALAQYVRFGNCDRLLYFILHPEKERELAGRWRVRPQPLTPLLHAEGERYEREVVTGVAASGEVVVDLKHRGASATTEYLRRAGAGRRVVLAQAALDGEIGGWPCGGTADLIWLIPHPPAHAPGEPAGNGATGGAVPVAAVVADVKASLTARVEHRLQVAFYARLLRQMAAQAGVTLVSVSGVVLHREPDAPLPALSPDALEPFDLVPYDLALDHLLAGPEAVVPRVQGQRFETVPYSLDFKCDGCLFNGHCFHESQAQESLTLVPYLTAPEQRVLEQHGITTFRQLAALTQPASPQRYRGPLDPAPGQEGLLATLRAHWQLGGLDRHTQRARAMVRDRDQVRGDFEPVVDAGFGTLPAEETHPGLVKVFFDAQHDYVRDAVYLLGALVTGPGGEQIILERTAAPPERETEGAALARWVLRVYGAVLAVAQQPQAFVHLYTYSRHDQAVLLAALRRHVGRVPAIGALFDLLTDSAALAPISPLAQPMVSFLAEEVRERM
ncbi:MAG TPA: hypothetical protein VHN78_04040, partial [Chloroflexota bacterium]|nr:hypothetical protein [Chloroflexota bacterium]